MTQTFSQSTIPFKAWDLDLLVDYVLKFHHRYIRKQGEELAIRLNSLTANHPELDRVVDHFRNSVADLDLTVRRKRIFSFHTLSTFSMQLSTDKSMRPSIVVQSNIRSMQ